jgi:hypothetical protein
MNKPTFKKLIKENSIIREGYTLSRKSRERVTSVYDISTICNLKCDGCLFFDKDGGYSGTNSSPSLSDYENFFIKERERGVNYPIFGGAEAGLKQDILHVAAKVWSEGMLHTNGTARIHPDIPFRLYVSSWGHRNLTNKWRGANCYDKVINNISGDSRVILNYTINRMNINDILPVVEDCSIRNIPITFQVYSPTSDYLTTLKDSSVEKYKFIHSSTADDNLILQKEDNSLACEIIKKAIKKYPEIILFTNDLADWTFKNSSFFPNDSLNTDEVPPSCDVAMNKQHSHHLADLSIETRKTCGHPEIECKTCRTYTTIYTTYFQNKLALLKDEQSILEYFSAHEIFHKIFHIKK